MTYDVVVAVENPELLLKPGMTANVNVVTASEPRSVRVPIDALRFAPPGQPPADSAALDGAPGRQTRVWVLEHRKVTPVTITTGLSDGTWVEVADGDLQEGDRVVTDEIRTAASHARIGIARRWRRSDGRNDAHAALAAVRACMNTVIQIVGMTKTYVLGDIEVHALRGVNLTIERGEFVAVMGASGSGKSTLMNMLGCLDRPTSGRYILEGEDVAQLNESELATIRSRRIGFVFQNFNLLSRTSTLENVELPLFYSAWTADGEHRAADLVKLVGLAGREQSHPNQLSGGQQQRVAIARALVNRPSILLADEPTGNLDSTNSAEIMDVLTKLNREQGITVIVVTHDPDVAAYADRIVTFRDGVIISDTRKEGCRRARRSRRQAGGGALRRDASSSRQPRSLDEVWTFASMAVVAAGRAIRRNKLRAALTMLGIFIGVAAVITMVAVGDGAKSSVEAQINSLGTNLLVVLPGATTANGVRAGSRQQFDAHGRRRAGDRAWRRPGRAGDATWIGRWRRWSRAIATGAPTSRARPRIILRSATGRRRSDASSPTPKKRRARRYACSDRRW